MKIKIVRWTAVFLLLVMMFSVTSCGGIQETLDTRTVMTLGSHEVPHYLYRYFFMKYKEELEGDNPEIWNTDESKRSLLDSYVKEAIARIYAVRELAEEYDLALDSEAKKKISTTMDNLRNEYANDEEYLNALSMDYMSHKLYKEILEFSYLEEVVRSYIIDEKNGIVASDTETVEKDIQENFLHVTHIMITGNGEEEKQKAEDLLERLKNGEDFVALAREYSEDTVEPEIGYYITQYEFLEPFEEAAMALQPGQISEVVFTGSSFHIIKRLELDDAYISEYFEELLEKYKYRCFLEILYERMDTFACSYTDVYQEFSVTA